MTNVPHRSLLRIDADLLMTIEIFGRKSSIKRIVGISEEENYTYD